MVTIKYLPIIEENKAKAIVERDLMRNTSNLGKRAVIILMP